MGSGKRHPPAACRNRRHWPLAGRDRVRHSACNGERCTLARTDIDSSFAGSPECSGCVCAAGCPAPCSISKCLADADLAEKQKYCLGGEFPACGFDRGDCSRNFPANRHDAEPFAEREGHSASLAIRKSGRTSAGGRPVRTGRKDRKHGHHPVRHDGYGADALSARLRR